MQQKHEAFATKHQNTKKQKMKQSRKSSKKRRDSEDKSKKSKSFRILNFMKLLKNYTKKKSIVKSFTKELKKEILFGKSPHPILNCSYETGDPYVTTYQGKTYTCQMTYLVTHVMRCITIKIKNSSEDDGSSLGSRYVQQCLVEKKRQVHSWRCSRRLSDTQWYSFSFKHINSSTPIRNMTSYAGMSFICTRTKRKNKDYSIKWVNNTFCYVLLRSLCRWIPGTSFASIGTLFYKNNFIKHEAHFCSKFKNKLRTIPASAEEQSLNKNNPSLGRRTKSQIFTKSSEQKTAANAHNLQSAFCFMLIHVYNGSSQLSEQKTETSYSLFNKLALQYFWL